MHYEMMTVTPELAQRWLEAKNTRNRNISWRKVAAYANDMREGRWQATHQNAIAFYKDGNLADGQHRLSAIVKASVSVEFMVWFGLDDKAAYGIDAHKMRATQDQIKIAGGSEWITKDIVACARVMMLKDRGVKIFTPQQITEFCENHKEAIIFSHLNLPKTVAVSAPIRAAVATAFYYEDHADLSNWCSIIASGVGAIPLSKTVLVLRERVIRDGLGGGNSLVREGLTKMAMRSIQAYCAGHVLTRIVEPKDRPYAI